MKRALYLLYPIAFAALICSCQPAVHTIVSAHKAPQSPSQRITVTTDPSQIPEGSIVLCDIAVEDGGFTTDCAYDYVVELAKQKARYCGADMLLITNHRPPDFWSTCHQIRAFAYSTPNADRNEIAESDYTSPGNQSHSVTSTPSRDDTRENIEGQNNEPVKSNSADTDSRGSDNNEGYFGNRITSDEIRPGQNASSRTSADQMGTAEILIPEREEPTALFSGFGGFSRRLAPIADNLTADEENFYREQKGGINFGFDFSFRVAPSNYIGFHFNKFTSSSEMEGIISPVDPNGNTNTVAGVWEENVAINFYGLQWLTTTGATRSGSQFYLSAALGYTEYVNEGTMPVVDAIGNGAFLPFNMRGGSFGSRLEGGGQIALGDNVFIKLGLGLNSGIISTIDFEIGNESSREDLEEDERIGLVRADFFAGLVIGL